MVELVIETFAAAVALCEILIPSPLLFINDELSMETVLQLEVLMPPELLFRKDDAEILKLPEPQMSPRL